MPSANFLGGTRALLVLIRYPPQMGEKVGASGQGRWGLTPRQATTALEKSAMQACAGPGMLDAMPVCDQGPRRAMDESASHYCK